MRTAVLAVLATALLAARDARAQPVSSLSGPGPDTYIELHLGTYLPQHRDLDVVDPGVAVGGTFGARFSPYVSVEGGAGWVRASGREGSTKITVSDVPVTASLRLRAPYRFAEISAMGGAALHIASFSSEVDLVGLPASTVSDTAVALGYHVGLGVAFQLSPTMLFGVDVRRTFVEPQFSGTGVRLDGLRAAVTLTYHL
jgi:hypothetical protein